MLLVPLSGMFLSIFAEKRRIFYLFKGSYVQMKYAHKNSEVARTSRLGEKNLFVLLYAIFPKNQLLQKKKTKFITSRKHFKQYNLKPNAEAVIVGVKQQALLQH